MDSNVKMKYIELLKKEISPALGCTEPAAVALCAAGAAALLDQKVKNVVIQVSSYILKNGMNVGIPGFGSIGLDLAGALGAVCARPEKELLVLDNLSEREREEAEELMRQGLISLDCKKEKTAKIYISVKVYGEDHTAEAVIEDKHTNFTRKIRDDVVLWEREECQIQETTSVDDITLDEIWDFVQEVPGEQLSFLQRVVDMNMEISEEGMRNEYGIHVGRAMFQESKLKLIGDNIANRAAGTTAAAVDARMAGCTKSVISVAGSGNQGLTATVPVIIAAEAMNSNTDALYRSLALSILVTIHVKHYIGRLSVLCGCSIASSIGVCAAMIFLGDGLKEAMRAGVRTMAADLSGMICDGAKPGCALKIATSVNAAALAAQLALNGTGATKRDGIVTDDLEETLRNLGKLGNEGMSEANDEILKMLLDKKTTKMCG